MPPPSSSARPLPPKRRESSADVAESGPDVVPAWVSAQHARLQWKKDRANRHKEKHRADWDALIKEFGDHEDDCTDAESSQRAPELKLLDDWEQIRQKFALTPAGLNPARNIAMINGRPVVILVLTHEAETLSAKMPYMSAACEGCPVMLMWGRCARKEPTCTPATSIFWWFMDRVGLITSLL